ncbi:Cro/CI family transcriptional regulator [Delftia sp. PS-11]|uniref:Cro/CI family transcriptional regulator n=1 Tax=Delftia sp. PS-11 TaxID=2767222 RepID=UPI002454E08B|nr:Cro/CI family transcriptional regulator [Delftia sp. PS-11]KAJ8741796.1 helix-turn-helix domain-containing protein [Delftia sp. PS-11]
MTTDDAVRYAGSAAALAKLLGVSPGAVSQWRDFPPWPRQLQLERMTGGALSAEPNCLPQPMSQPQGATHG